MPYNEGDENKYFPMMLASLIAIAIAVSAFIYSVVRTEPGDVPYDDIEGVSVEMEDGNAYVNPTEIGPSGPPSVPFPTAPPPGSSN
ncbi:hypothetical protein GF354_06420 [Candidatus Peregrinibacteria bacterium]|nr:hypothetical protein [Candidatus Peregrinibacteria bacterium]